MNRKLSLVCIIIIALALASTSSAMDTVVIGKATIKKGASLPIMIVLQNGQPIVGVVKAFEEQVLYITNKVDAHPGEHRGGYMLDGQGFVHDCPTHGRELMDQCIVVLPIEEVENGNVKVELF